LKSPGILLYTSNKKYSMKYNLCQINKLPNLYLVEKQSLTLRRSIATTLFTPYSTPWDLKYIIYRTSIYVEVICW
jgi:hypothetical protein